MRVNRNLGINRIRRWVLRVSIPTRERRRRSTRGGKLGDWIVNAEASITPTSRRMAPLTRVGLKNNKIWRIGTRSAIRPKRRVTKTTWRLWSATKSTITTTRTTTINRSTGRTRGPPKTRRVNKKAIWWVLTQAPTRGLNSIRYRSPTKSRTY